MSNNKKIPINHIKKKPSSIGTNVHILSSGLKAKKYSGGCNCGKKRI